MAEKIAEERQKSKTAVVTCSLTAADILHLNPHLEPRQLWRILKKFFREEERAGRVPSSGLLQAWVAETVEDFQGKFLRQEHFRRLDDLEDEEERIEHDVWKKLDKVVEAAADKFKLTPDVIWEALLAGFRIHPKLADIVDDVPGTVIFKAGEDFRVTSDRRSVWARSGTLPGQAPRRIVFTSARIFKVALIPMRHSTDLNEQRPWHHFRLLKKQGSRVIEREVEVPGKLVVKGSTYLPAIRAVRDLGVRVYMRAGMQKEYGAQILRFLDWEPTRRIGKRLPRIGSNNTVDGRDFRLRPDGAVMPSSLTPATADHEFD